MYSYLSEIEELTDNNLSLNSTLFQYGDNEVTNSEYASLVYSTNNDPSGTDYVPGDYNGDGVTDLIRLFFTRSNNVKVYNSFNLMLNSKQDVLNFSNRSTITIPPGFNIEETNNFVAFNSLGNFLGGDFNGDGKKDFILTNKTISTDGSKINTIRVYTSTGERFSFVDYDFRNYSHNRFFYKAPYFVHLGDFDGDGLTDIGLILSNGISYSFIVIQKGQIKNYGQLAVNPSLIDNIYVTDFNGNGKDELFIVQSFNDINRRAQIIEVNKINGQDMLETIYGSGYPTHWHKLLRVGDFNGDGKTDILHYNSPNSWTVGYFNGNGFSTKNIPSVNISLSAELTDQSLRVMDVNGDGKSDITYFTGSKKVIWYSTGDQFIETLDDSPWNGNRTDYLMVGDFDGDGKLDEICPVYFGDINRFKIYYRHKNNHSFLLKKVADGFNNITEFDYAPYDARDNNFMFNNYNFTTSKFNIMSFNVPTTVVKKVKTTNPNGGINELEFLYRTMFFSRAKGMLGFNQVFTYNPKTNTTSCTESEPFENNDFPLVFPKINYVYRSRVFGHLNSAVLSSEKPTLQLQKINNNQYWIKNIGSHSYNSLNRLNTYNQLQYDDFGNVVYAKTTLGTGPNSVITEVTNTYTQKNTFIPAHVETTEKKLTRNGQTPVIKKQAFEYDALGRLVKETVHPNHALQSQTQFVYDNFGNVTQTILTASNLPTQVSKLVYDDLGRNIIKKINEQNQESNYTFTHLYDLPETITNIYGEKTEFEYDAFGNLIKTKMPNGDEMETITEWAISQGDNSSYQNQSTLYKITNKTTNQPTSISWYNRAGLEVKSTTEGLSNTFIKSMAYDDLGRVIQATEPFYQGETPIVISTVYDDLGRVISQGTPSQKQLFAYSYTPETSIVSTTFPDGTIKKTTTDASGLTIKAEDNGGALVYTYYSDGNLKSVSLNGTEMVSLEYDINGNKTKTVDKNAGTYTYQYNAYGLIKQQTNPNNQTNTYNYDNFNRLINAQTPEGAIVYTYINEGKGLNQVKTINYPKYALTYEYGNFNQISKITEVIDDQTLVYNYQYDNKGNKTTLTYPSGFKIKYNYTDKGFLNKITSDLQPNITLWEAQEQNSMGVTNKYLSGNGVQTVKTFDDFKLPKTIKAGNIMDLELDFNPENANLRFRKDKLRNLTEVFNYDNLDRLTQSKVNNYTPITINYAPNGNITQKSDVGAYVYDATKVNAVKEVNSNNLDVLAQQNITYSSFQSPTLIKEGDYQLELLYSHDRSRKKTTLKQNNQTKQTTYFSGGYEKQVDAQNNTTELHYLNNINTIVVKQNNQYQYYFTYKDHLGTIVAITDINGNVVEEFNYDAWGLKRNPDNWTYELDTTPSTLTWFKRGYTGHEHLDEFGLINMNSRLYDPQIGRMLSPDNYIQSSGYSQNYNRYSYVWNNPMKYTDPSGDFVFTALAITGTILLYTTEQGYEIQKYLSPVAVQLDLKTGTHQRGIGINVSVGMPQASPIVGARAHGGATYYTRNNQGPKGWEYRYGYELSAPGGLLVVGSTYYSHQHGGGEFKQRVGHMRIGLPLLNVKYHNDWFFDLPNGDSGDRWRTAAFRLDVLGIEIGVNMQTGDPGRKNNDRSRYRDENGQEYYQINENGSDPDKYRMGVGYIGIGGLIRFGNDKESRRDYIQNQVVHNATGDPYFNVINQPNRNYFQFGTNTIW
jgi:RHS repeat-associated protein